MFDLQALAFASDIDARLLVQDGPRRLGARVSESRGLLGQGSILALTSVADRTSPVLRGKWIMEVLLGSPPPAPPPNVPPLDETKARSRRSAAC